MVEVWKEIEEFEDYEVSNLGRIKSYKQLKEGNILNPWINNKGYLIVDLCLDGKSYHKLVHILMYENFNNYKLKLNECIHHINENCQDNYLKNFKKMTKIEHASFHNKGEKNSFYGRKHSKEALKLMSGVNNHMFGKHHSEGSKKKTSIKIKEMFKNGELNQNGSRNPFAKLTENKVIKIWKYLDDGILNQKEIGKLFGVSGDTISSIKKGRSWQDIKRIK